MMRKLEKGLKTMGLGGLLIREEKSASQIFVGRGVKIKNHMEP